MNPFKRCVIALYVLARAICRFMFVDIGGSGYFTKEFTPASKTFHDYKFQGEPERTYGEDMPLLNVVSIVIFAVAFCWLWIPLLAGIFGWEAFKKWIGDDV